MHWLRIGALLSASVAVGAGCGGPAPEDDGAFGEDVSALSQWSVMELGGGWSPSLTFDTKGFPVVSVAQGVPNPTNDGGDVRPVIFSNGGGWRTGAGWSSQGLPHQPGFRNGNTNSLAFGTTPRLVFSCNEIGKSKPIHLHMATWGGAGWQVETIDDEGWIYQAVHRTLDDMSWVVYSDPSLAQRLRVATDVSGVWETHTVSVPFNLLNSMDFAVSTSKEEKPVLGIATTSYSTPGGLYFTTSRDAGETWEPVVHVDDTWGMIGPQIAYAGSNPMIAYTELDSHKAKFAYSADGGETWTYETIATFDVNPATGLAVDPRNGQPVVAIVARDLASAEHRLYVARRNFLGTWSLEIVDRASLAMNYLFAVNPRIAVNENGEVAIAWERYQGNDRRVRFAWDASPVVIGPGLGH